MYIIVPVDGLAILTTPHTYTTNPTRFIQIRTLFHTFTYSLFRFRNISSFSSTTIHISLIFSKVLYISSHFIYIKSKKSILGGFWSCTAAVTVNSHSFYVFPVKADTFGYHKPLHVINLESRDVGLCTASLYQLKMEGTILELADFISDTGDVKVTCTIQFDRYTSEELSHLTKLQREDLGASISSIFPLNLGPCEVKQK